MAYINYAHVQATSPSLHCFRTPASKGVTMSQHRITSDNEQIGASTSLPLRSISRKSRPAIWDQSTGFTKLCATDCVEGRTGSAVSRTVISRRKGRHMGDLPLAWDANSSEASNEDGWARSDNDETDATDHAATFPTVAKRRSSRSGSGEVIPLAEMNIANLRIAGSELTLEHSRTRKHSIYVIQVRRTPSQYCFLSSTEEAIPLRCRRERWLTYRPKSGPHGRGVPIFPPFTGFSEAPAYPLATRGNHGYTAS